MVVINWNASKESNVTEVVIVMKKSRKLLWFPVLTFVLALFVLPAGMAPAASKYDAVFSKWTRTQEHKDKFGSTFTLKATLYTTQYIDALIQHEAEQNMWTASELEDYKYNFLKGLRLDDYIAIHLEMDERGPTAHMAPFNEMVYLWIGKKKYAPAEYDQRFNFPLLGKREGLVFFPRYDEKTGESFFKKDVTLRFVMSGAASPVSDGKDIRFTWDVKGREDDASMSGTAADRIEVDRLLRRVEKLAKEKSDLESQLAAKNRELEEVNARIEELQKK